MLRYALPYSLLMCLPAALNLTDALSQLPGNKGRVKLIDLGFVGNQKSFILCISSYFQLFVGSPAVKFCSPLAAFCSPLAAVSPLARR